MQGESAAALFNDRRAKAAEMWSATGICAARSLARMYAAALGDVEEPRLISGPVLRAATRLQARGRDRCMLMQSAFGLGFGLHSRFSPFTGPGAFGHYGIGGSFGFADRARRLAVGYVTSQMVADAVGDPQTRAIRAALIKALPNV